MTEQARTVTFSYHVNLDERGVFYADVRNSSGRTVFEIKIDSDGGDEWDSWEDNIFTDGFMRHKKDIDGLKEYLVDIGVMNAKQRLVMTDGGDRVVRQASHRVRKACAEKAMQSDDESVRGMASFYVNTVKP